MASTNGRRIAGGEPARIPRFRLGQGLGILSLHL
jgi:hypothetical protein